MFGVHRLAFTNAEGRFLPIVELAIVDKTGSSLSILQLLQFLTPTE
jgi:hypothetical protein